MTQSAERGIVSVTAGPVDLVGPVDAPAGQVLRYGVALPFQVAPDKAAIWLNVRRLGVPCIDFEVGADAVVFDSLDNLPDSARSAATMTRSEQEDYAPGDTVINVKHVLIAGFVPLGAKLDDGSPHPHAGTGFAFGIIVPFAADFSERLAGESAADGKGRQRPRKRSLEMLQLAFDGTRIVVTERRRLGTGELLAGWDVVNRGLRIGISDGEDILAPIHARPLDQPACSACISRWKRIDGRWQPVWASVASDQHWGEGTLIRDLDGSLLMGARCGPHNLGDSASYGVGVWRSTDGGQNWKRAVDAPRVRSSTPVTLHQAADGTPYVTANPWREACFNARRQKVGLWSQRQKLYLWQVNDARDALGPPMLLRDADLEFGAPSETGVWFIDHGVDATVRLADGKWHNLLGYRIRQHKGQPGDVEEATPQTGSYIEEVVSAGPPRPEWKF